jgi:hypothetical protein
LAFTKEQATAWVRDVGEGGQHRAVAAEDVAASLAASLAAQSEV